MEVASPIPFQRVQTGNKRRFACSPMVDSHRIGMDVGVDDFSMVEENSSFGNLNKRRRFTSTENLETSSPLPANRFASLPLSSFTAGASSSGPLGNTLKRQRYCEGSEPTDNQIPILQKTIQEQATEIINLKCDKDKIESSITNLRHDNEKLTQENKILKRAVTIQQDRQNQSATEIENARRYKEQADEQIRKLEQAILTLRYHLQTMQSCGGNNNFMNFGPRPPDVY